jgi:hypothetical protein
MYDLLELLWWYASNSAPLRPLSLSSSGPIIILLMRSAYAWDDRECVHIGWPVRKNTLTWDLEVSIYILCRGQIQMETVHTVQLILPSPRSNVPDVVTPAKMPKEIPNLMKKRPTRRPQMCKCAFTSFTSDHESSLKMFYLGST